MVVGEAQILGQVKRAYHASVAAGIACSWLECLFEEAFRCARHVRRDTSLGSGSVSMATLAVGVVTAGERSTDAAIAIVGSGEMSSTSAMSGSVPSVGAIGGCPEACSRSSTSL